MVKTRKTLLLTILAIVLIGVGYFSVNITMHPTKQGDWVGISVHSLSIEEARLVKDSGARWIRIDASENLSLALSTARAYNLKVLCILDSWMFDLSTVFTLEQWRGNVTHYVTQYADKVDAWEIYNEPASPAFTLDKTTSAQNISHVAEFYLSMVKIASPLIRQYDPTAKILLFGGLQLWTGNDSYLELDKEFARQLAARDIGQYGDAISIHAYPWMDQLQPIVWQKYDQSLAYYKGLFNGGKTLEVWITETGQSIDASGENGQAQYIADVLAHFHGKVDHVFCYTLTDNTLDNKSFGLVQNGVPRPAYYELQKAINT